MNMIGLAVHLQQRAAPGNAEVGGDFLQSIEHRFRQAAPAVFCHEDKMIIQAVRAMK